MKENKGNQFFNIVAMIGAILIFVGIAWLIAKNWHYIPNLFKVAILGAETIAGFTSGYLLRQRDYEGIGRALLVLGGLLYILSLFLISQTYHLAVTTQHYIWILFLSFTVLWFISYVLDSKENLIVAMITFFPWVIMQYVESVNSAYMAESTAFFIGLIFILAGSLFYGLAILHKSIKHNFAGVYNFWTALYFLVIFFLLSNQSILPILSETQYEQLYFTPFLIFFTILCICIFVCSGVYGIQRKSIGGKEFLIGIAIILVLIGLILLPKLGEGTIGSCMQKTCYDFKTMEDCNGAPETLLCEWNQHFDSRESCIEKNCWAIKTQTECLNADPNLKCEWIKDLCQDTRFKRWEDSCRVYDNNKETCLQGNLCKWYASSGMTNIQNMPTAFWISWLLNNIAFIGAIILVIGWGQKIGSHKIVNLGIAFFVLEIFARYIGFWMDFKGYFAFSILAITGGVLLIMGAYFIPKWRKKLLKETKK